MKYLNPSSEQLYDDSGRQMKQLSTDPVRSNSQIYVNLKNWVAANMNECPHALKHYNKLSVSFFIKNLGNFRQKNKIISPFKRVFDIFKDDLFLVNFRKKYGLFHSNFRTFQILY